MTPELDRQLRARFPLVFAGPLMNDEPIRCRDGWFDVLDRLCAKLQKLIHAEAMWSRYRAVQVKEKFGTLRFYLARETPGMTDAIREAEQESARTCDVCGKPGILRGDEPSLAPWVRTRCDEHVDWREWQK